ncbi:MAG: YihY/virulence factor BrkB family protein, partial [Deltaproteobacteria bacterium]|nr:YihY/virulence factor BrkB family protein [Deltaproteobacteria bacterium]
MRFWRGWQHWWRTSDSLNARWLRAAHEALLGEMPILAAGTSLFAILAVVPLLAAVVSIYGLVSDPFQIHQHLRGLEQVIPAEIVDFLGDQLERQAKRSSSTLGLQLAGSILVALISARSSARALVDALNRAYRVREKRSGLVRLALSLAMGLGTLAGLMILLGIVVALPAIVATLNLHGFHLVRYLRWPLLLGLVFLTLLALYRWAPSPRPLGTERHVWPGAALATVLLVIVSFLL